MVQVEVPAVARQVARVAEPPVGQVEVPEVARQAAARVAAAVRAVAVAAES